MLAGVLLARDLVYLAFGRELIVPLAELVVLALYLLWVRLFTGLQAADVVYLAVNFLALIAGAASFFLPWLPLTPAALSLLLLADVIYLAILLGLVSPYNTEEAQLLMETRFVIIAGLFLVQVIGLLYGYTAPLIHNLLLPAASLVHFYVLLAYNRHLHAGSRRAIQFYSSNLDSTYDFMENLGNAITAKIDLVPGPGDHHLRRGAQHRRRRRGHPHGGRVRGHPAGCGPPTASIRPWARCPSWRG